MDLRGCIIGVANLWGTFIPDCRLFDCCRLRLSGLREGMAQNDHGVLWRTKRAEEYWYFCFSLTYFYQEISEERLTTNFREKLFGQHLAVPILVNVVLKHKRNQ